METAKESAHCLQEVPHFKYGFQNHIPNYRIYGLRKVYRKENISSIFEQAAGKNVSEATADR